MSVPSMDGVAENVLSQGFTSPLGCSSPRGQKWCGRWLRMSLLGGVIHAAELKYSLQGKMAAWWSPLGRDSSRSATQTSNTATFPGELAPCVRQASHCLCGTVVIVPEMSGKALGRDLSPPPSVLLAFCSIHLCWRYLIGNTVFPCWGG